MRLINLDTLKAGDKLGAAIKTQDGSVLLPAHATLTDVYIRRLKAFGVVSLFIDDELFDEVRAKPSLSDETWLYAIDIMQSVFAGVSAKKMADADSVKRVAKEITSDVRRALLSDPISLYKLFAVKDPRVTHAINTAVIVSALAITSGSPYTFVEESVQAALLHDMYILTMGEDAENLNHSDDAANKLKSEHTYSTRVYTGVAMHHERYDGSGFPKGYSGESINETARMIAVADYYDNVTNGYGCEKQPFNYAVEMLSAEAGKTLDPKYVSIFNQIVAVYPTGVTVRLNNGFQAVVVGQNQQMPARPRVRLLRPTREECLLFNMLTQTTLFIDSVEL